MRKAKKITALVLAVIFAVALLAGCSGKNNDNAESTKKETTDTTGNNDGNADNKQEETYTYTIIQWLPAPLDDDAPMVKKWEEEFGVKFKFDYIETTKIAELLPLRIASGDIPDIITSLNYNGFYDYAKQGIAGTWDEEFFRENAPNISEVMDEMGEDSWKISKYNGKMFTVPGINCEYMYGAAMIWRVDWLKNLGINEIPYKLDDVEATFYKFRNNDPDGNNQKDTYGLSQDGIRMILGAFGVPEKNWIEDGNGGVIYSSVAPQTKDALTLLRKWYKDEVLDPEFITGENKGGYWALSHAFCNGRIGFTARAVNAHWKDPKLWELGESPFANSELFKKNNPDGTFAYGRPFEGPEGKKFTGFRNYSFWSCFSADHVKNAPKFAKFLKIAEKLNGFIDPKDYLTTRLGIQGQHWDYDDNGNPVPFEQYQSAEDATRIGALTAFEFFNNMKTQSVSNPVYDNWENNELYADENMYAIWPTLVPLPLPSAGDYKDETDKIIDETFISIITGEKDISYFDEMVEKWKKAGGDTLTKEANEIYQNFK